MTSEELEKEYRARSDDELLRLALTPEHLTPEAHATLANELARRGIADEYSVNLARERHSQLNRYANSSVPSSFARSAYLSVVNEIRESWRRFGSLSPLKRLGIVAVALLLIGTPCWRAWQNARNGELELLYNSAFTGNLESVRKLSSYRLLGETDWLERLARDRDADAYARVEAIKHLTDNRSANPRLLVPLLWIEVPYIVRHETAHFFIVRGCTDECIRMSLDSLHATWSGHLMLEAERQSEGREWDADEKRFLEALRASSETDYLTLLNSVPCTALRISRTDYPSDTTFSTRLRSVIKPC